MTLEEGLAFVYEHFDSQLMAVALLVVVEKYYGGNFNELLADVEQKLDAT